MRVCFVCCRRTVIEKRQKIYYDMDKMKNMARNETVRKRGKYVALERGGRADKAGNQYENHFLGKQLLLLVQNRLKTVEVEPLGEAGNGVEFISVSEDDRVKYYQCKASNASGERWNFSDLERYDLFKTIKDKLSASEHAEFHFISPLSYNGLGDLCDRARTNHSVQDFLAYQLTNKTLRDAFQQCERKFGLSRTDEIQLNQLVNILSRCYFEQIPFCQETRENMELQISCLFSGEESNVRILLENFVNDERKYGIKLCANDIVVYLQGQGIRFKNYGRDGITASRIQEINHTCWRTYSPIHGSFIERKETQMVMDALNEGLSVVLHGKAGTGKSGCVELVSRSLEENHIPYLRIKLDEYIPQNNTIQYGRDLGLLDSPVRCLQSIAGQHPCVLILDQLDTLRWTSTHSPTALAVCKEMIKEMKTANDFYGCQMSILFVTRTFDYKNDHGLRQLFDESREESKAWKHIEVSLLTEQEAACVVGKNYASLSPKLKALLKNPASLWVWSRLEKPYQMHFITSANQLVYEWWKEILERSEKRGYSANEVSAFTQQLAQKMSSTSSFAVPAKMYSGYHPIISFLCSEGMIADSRRKIAFAHQTFLDYFIVCERLDQIVSGTSILEIIGGPDDQRPNLRYRFFVLLQELIDYDEEVFLKECHQILNADTVRFYYQCVVFDALAQQNSPGRKLCRFIWDYWKKDLWNAYVYQVVYSGSPAYVRSLKEMGYSQWLSEEGSVLLRSVSAKDPEFVVDVVTPYCFVNEKQDWDVLSCLCFDVSDDTEEMYQLRMKLLRAHPHFMTEHWMNFYHLFQKNTSRITDYLLFLLEYRNQVNTKNIHFPELKGRMPYIEETCADFVHLVVPELMKITAGMAEDYENNWFCEEYTQWEKSNYHGNVLRKILEMAKAALGNFAAQYPEEFAAFMFKEEYASSLIGNELILSAAKKLPVSYGEQILTWISEDFPKHIFNYTENSADFLADTKDLLRSYSPECSQSVYEQLEQRIIQWKEPVSRMVSILKDRMETNRGRAYFPVYYAYWGFMQKELLPVMDASRRSEEGTQLLLTVNRNDWIRVPHYRRKYAIGMAKGVRSPIAGYSDRISDKTWLRIIRTPNEKMCDHNWKETPAAYIEATHVEFASSLGREAEKYPKRFANLSLQFPEDCAPMYISSVLRALCHDKDPEEPADLLLTSRVIRKFADRKEKTIQICIPSIVRKRSEEQWPEDILSMMEKMACQPFEEPVKTYSSDDCEKQETARTLYMEVYNSYQGEALRAIGSLLSNHLELHERFQKFISELSDSEVPFILAALTECIAPYFNSDPEFAGFCFRKILQKEHRILLANDGWDMLMEDFKNARTCYYEPLFAAARSEMGDLAEQAAGFLCALAIYCQDDVLYRALFDLSYSSEQAERICSQAVYSYQYDPYRDKSKEIILHMIKNYDIQANAVSPDFLKAHIVIERDKEFLMEVIHSASKGRPFYAIPTFLCDTEESILDFADIIHAFVKHSVLFYQNQYSRLGLDELIRCVAHLYDEGKDDEKIRRICLDAWDELYKNNLHGIRELSAILDDLN